MQIEILLIKEGFFMWKEKLLQHRFPDLILLFLVCSLLIIGILMVYSSSNIWAEYKYGDNYFFVKRQLLFIAVGFVCMSIISYIPYNLWKQYVNPIITIGLESCRESVN